MTKYNKNIQKFIMNNDIDIDYFENNMEAMLFNKFDITPIIARWGVYENEKMLEVSIADVIGKSIHTSKNILLELNELFDETADTYQKRSISMLEYNKDTVMDGLKESFYKDYITLTEIRDGKYVIKDNGMHRCSLIRTYYLNELKNCKQTIDIEKLKNKFTIVVFAEKLDIIKTYSSYLLYLANENIIIEQELDENYKKTNNVILNDEKGVKTILDDRKLLEYLRDNIYNISQRDLEDKVLKLYKEDINFEKFTNENLRGTSIGELIWKR